MCPDKSDDQRLVVRGKAIEADGTTSQTISTGLTMESLRQMLRRLEWETGVPDEMPEGWREIRLGTMLYDVTRARWDRKVEQLSGRHLPKHEEGERSIEIDGVKVVKDDTVPPDRGYVVDVYGEIVALILMGGETGEWWKAVGHRERLPWKNGV